MKNQTLQRHKNAVWDYILEHSDVTENGALFVKFHVTSRTQFEGHVNSRINDHYHRHDTRTDETHKEKDSRSSTLRNKHKKTKKVKREKWKASQAERRKILEAVKRENEMRHLSPIKKFLRKLKIL